MNLSLNDRQTTTVLTALELLRSVKQLSIFGTDEEKSYPKQINQYDLLAREHTLMHTLTLLSKMTGKPVEYFSHNPSQAKPESTHEEPTHGQT